MTLWLIDDIAFALFVEEVTQLDEAWRGKSFGNMKKPVVHITYNDKCPEVYPKETQ